MFRGDLLRSLLLFITFYNSGVFLLSLFDAFQMNCVQQFEM